MSTLIDMNYVNLHGHNSWEASMRIVLVHPNYHSGGAEIAGNWPPAWVAYLAGHLKDAGFTDIHFIDAMTNDLSDEDLSGPAQGTQARCGWLDRHYAVDLQGGEGA
jgi:hypothetical protein